MNVHVDTEFQFPPEYTEGDKILALVEFWMKFHPEVRKKFIEHHDDRSNMFDHADGVIMAILRGLQQIDLEKLKREIAEGKRGGDLENSIKEARIHFGKDPDPNAKPGGPRPGDRVIVISEGNEFEGVITWRGQCTSYVKLDTPQKGCSLWSVGNDNIKKIPGDEP